MIEPEDKALIEHNALGLMTDSELRRLHEVCQVDWVFDDSGPECESLMTVIERELQYRRRQDPPRLIDSDRQILRIGEKVWHELIKPILEREGLTIREFGETDA